MLSISPTATNAILPSDLPKSGLPVFGDVKDNKSASEMAAVFQQFVGETFFQLMLKSLRDMHDKPAYLHGGQAETLFQGQLDQEMASQLSQTKVGSFSDDLYKRFQAQIKNPV